MLNDPLTLGNVILANLIMMAPVYVLVIRGVWYVARITGKVETVYKWWERTQIKHGSEGESD